MVTAKQLLHAHDTIRKHANEREFPAQLQAIFLLIASNGGDMAQADIAPAVGISPSSVTRNVKWLGKKHRLPHRAGLQWVVQYQLPKAKGRNWRAKRVKLTPKGRLVIDEALASPIPPKEKDLLSYEALREAVMSI